MHVLLPLFRLAYDDAGQYKKYEQDSIWLDLILNWLWCLHATDKSAILDSFSLGVYACRIPSMYGVQSVLNQ